MSRGGGVEAWEGMFRGVYLDIFIFPWPFFYLWRFWELFSVKLQIARNDNLKLAGFSWIIWGAFNLFVQIRESDHGAG